MSDAMLNEIYQELYAIRSRVEYLNEIWQETYAIRSKMETIDGTLNSILKEISGLRRDMRGDDDFSSYEETPPQIKKRNFKLFKRNKKDDIL